MYSCEQLVPIYKKEMLEQLALHFGMDNPAKKLMWNSRCS